MKGPIFMLYSTNIAHIRQNRRTFAAQKGNKKGLAKPPRNTNIKDNKHLKVNDYDEHSY